MIVYPLLSMIDPYFRNGTLSAVMLQRNVQRVRSVIRIDITTIAVSLFNEVLMLFEPENFSRSGSEVSDAGKIV